MSAFRPTFGRPVNAVKMACRRCKRQITMAPFEAPLCPDCKYTIEKLRQPLQKLIDLKNPRTDVYKTAYGNIMHMTLPPRNDAERIILEKQKGCDFNDMVKRTVESLLSAGHLSDEETRLLKDAQTLLYH